MSVLPPPTPLFSLATSGPPQAQCLHCPILTGSAKPSTAQLQPWPCFVHAPEHRSRAVNNAMDMLDSTCIHQNLLYDRCLCKHTHQMHCLYSANRGFVNQACVSHIDQLATVHVHHMCATQLLHMYDMPASHCCSAGCQ